MQFFIMWMELDGLCWVKSTRRRGTDRQIKNYLYLLKKMHTKGVKNKDQEQLNLWNGLQNSAYHGKEIKRWCGEGYRRNVGGGRLWDNGGGKLRGLLQCWNSGCNKHYHWQSCELRWLKCTLKKKKSRKIPLYWEVKQETEQHSELYEESFLSL